jgi:putative colanic acid biosynthesis acetyltransferase WcaF
MTEPVNSSSDEQPWASIDLRNFDKSKFERGRSKPVEIVWWVFKLLFIQSSLPWPSSLKSLVLRLFGAKVGAGLYMRPGVNVHFPWKLTIGDNVWVGDKCTILNLETVVIHSNAALAHEVYIAAAGHDITSPNFGYANAPVIVESGSWIATRAFIGPGVTVGRNAVVAAGSVVTKSIPPGVVVGGVPARFIARRNIDWENRN